MRENLSHTIHEAHKEVIGKKKKYIPNRITLKRMFTIMSEFWRGFKLLRKYDLAVTFFGSARSTFDDDVYQEARQLAHRLSEDGFAVITGGGEGVMGAANKGAFEAEGDSIGLNIELPFEQKINQFVTDSANFQHFFTRKVLLSFASEVYVYFPGGYGTLDELFEMMTLIQTKKIQRIPVILVDKEYWTPLIEWITKTLYEKNGAIDEKDLDIFHLVDSVDEAHETILHLIDELCPSCLKKKPHSKPECENCEKE